MVGLGGMGGWMRFDVFLESIAQMSVLGVNFLLDLDVSCEKLNLIIRQQEIMEPVIYWGSISKESAGRNIKEDTVMSLVVILQGALFQLETRQYIWRFYATLYRLMVR